MLAGLCVCTATGLRTRGGPGRPLLGVLAWEDMTVRPLPGRVGPGVWRGSKALPSGGFLPLGFRELRWYGKGPPPSGPPAIASRWDTEEAETKRDGA